MIAEGRKLRDFVDAEREREIERRILLADRGLGVGRWGDREETS